MTFQTLSRQTTTDTYTLYVLDSSNVTNFKDTKSLEIRLFFNK